LEAHLEVAFPVVAHPFLGVVPVEEVRQVRPLAASVLRVVQVAVQVVLGLEPSTHQGPYSLVVVVASGEGDRLVEDRLDLEVEDRPSGVGPLVAAFGEALDRP
jgi:hypothetical protein